MLPASPDKIGVFVAGGPAPGINAVIKGIVQEAENVDVRVSGYLDGARGLVHDHFVDLNRRIVENVHILGGSILGTSRYRIDEEGGDLERIVSQLHREGVDGLISIGGEGTLQLADCLRRAGLRVVHVPKTIDNDIAGLEQSFGFDTAVHEAGRMLSAVKLDAEAGDHWFVVEIMGRYTGHLALEAGLSAGCTRVLIPEDGPINVDDLLALMQTRAACGQDWGVILVAESAHFGEGYITRYGRLGGVAEELANRLDQHCQTAGLRRSIRTSNLGYFLRCARPTAFDRAYAAKLGYGAARFILDPQLSGQMVTVEHDHLVGVPMEEVAGKTKPVDLGGVRYAALCAMAGYESARVTLAGQKRALDGAAKAIRWLDYHADLETIRALAMRLGVPAETVIEVLQELARLDEAGEGT
jgi:6-phosphofructokinase